MLTGVQSVDQSTLMDLMTFAVNQGSNLMTFGDAGIGKTEMALQVIAAAKRGHVYLNLSLLEAPDLIGLPMVDEKTGRAKYALPEQFPQANPDERGLVLLVDEIDKAKPELQNPMLELFQFRSINGVKLNFHAILATGNLPDELAHSQTVSHALTNRCGVYRVTHSYDAWQEWAVQAQVNPLVVGFLSQNTNLLLQRPAGGDETAYTHPTPRAWTLAARDLDATNEKTPVEFQELLVAGRVGNGAATKFKVWLEHYRHIAPKITALVKDGTHPFEKGESPSLDRVFVCGIAGADAIMEATRAPLKGESKDDQQKRIYKTTKNVCGWLKTIPSEIGIGAVKSTLTMQAIGDYGLIKVPEFLEVYQKIRKAMKD